MAKNKLSGAMGQLLTTLQNSDSVPRAAPGKRLYERPATPEQVTAVEQQPGGRLVRIHHSRIDPWHMADRPESEFGDMQGLAYSIQNEQQQVPVLVRPAGDRYQLIFGRRRWKACQELDIDVLCLVREMDDAQAFAAQAIENAQRESLSAWARALSYQRALDAGLFSSVQALALKCGLDRTTVSNVLAFTRIPAPIAEAIGDMSQVGIQTAKSILKLADDHADVIIQHAAAIREGRLGPAKLEKLCAGKPDGPKAKVIKGIGGDLFSVTKSSRGALTLTILKNGKELLSEEEIVEQVKALFEAKAKAKTV